MDMGLDFYADMAASRKEQRIMKAKQKRESKESKEWEPVPTKLGYEAKLNQSDRSHVDFDLELYCMHLHELKNSKESL